MNATMTNDLLGKRVLVTTKTAYGIGGNQVQEWKVLEISPTGNYLLMMNGNGRKVWHRTLDIVLVEELRQIEPRPAISKEHFEWEVAYWTLAAEVMGSPTRAGEKEVLEMAKALRALLAKQQ